MTPDEKVDGKLQEMLRQLVLTPGFAPIAEFWENHPDIAQPFIEVVMSAYKSEYRSERIRKNKEARKAAADLKDLGLDIQQNTPDKIATAEEPPPKATYTDAHKHPDLLRYQDLYRILRRDNNTPRHKELCQIIMELGQDWDYDRGPRWPADEDKLFVEDLATNNDISEDSILLNSRQASRVRAIGGDFQKWLYEKYATMRKTNGGF
jgi:hypothetical protein